MKKIMHAAVRMTNGMVFLGKSHPDCFYQASYVGVKHSQSAKDQGFFTNDGRFLDREKSFEVAWMAGQVDGERAAAILFSEMLWAPVDGGKFKYDSIRGYYDPNL